MSTNQPKKALRKTNYATQAAIPEQSYADSYLSRTISDDGKSEFDVFDFARTSKMNVLIEGPTGLGKTSAALAYAAREKRPFYAIPSNVGIEPSQLFGKYVPDGQGGFVWIDGPVTTVVRNGGVLLINEVNFIPERVATVLFGLLDKRRQIVLLDHKAEVIDAADDLLIIADMNPEYEGTRPLNKAFRNRFALQMVWDYDTDTEGKLVSSETLRVVAQQIRNQAAAGVYETPVSTNMLMEFETVALAMGISVAIDNFVTHFDGAERAAVRQVLKTNETALTREILNPTKATDDDVAAAGTSEYDDDPDHPIWTTRRTAEDGYVDPEWGIKGVDWVLEDDDQDDWLTATV